MLKFSVIKMVKPVAAATVIAAAAFQVNKIKHNEPVDVFVTSLEEGEHIKSKNHKMDVFTRTLIEKEDFLKKEFNISDEKYDLYSKLAIGMAKEETLFGLGEGYYLKKSLPLACEILKPILTKKSSVLSIGLTNFKYDGISPNDKKNLKKYGVDKKTIYNPEKAAIATIYKLKQDDNKYKKYLKNIAPYHENPLFLEEYLLSLWKGYHLNTNDSKENNRKRAVRNMKSIVGNRNAKNPKEYVWKVLDSIGYMYDKENNCIREK